MHLTDTHAHLDDPQFAADLELVLERAHQAGVTRIITIGTGMESNRAALALANKYPQVYAALGIHPVSVQENNRLPSTKVEGKVEQELSWVEELRSLACHPKVVALGEMGLDYYHLPSDLSADSLEIWRQEQERTFVQQLDLAVELGLNVIIHQRDLPATKKVFSYPSAWDETLRLLRPYTGNIRAVFHCFGGTPEQVATILSLGHLISFTGIVTFKNALAVHEASKVVAHDQYMVETDAPYLAPAPYRGERAEPAHTRLVAEKIAALRGLSLEEVASTTTATAERFFRFS